MDRVRVLVMHSYKCSWTFACITYFYVIVTHYSYFFVFLHLLLLSISFVFVFIVAMMGVDDSSLQVTTATDK